MLYKSPLCFGLMAIVTGCFLMKDYRKKEFVYTAAGQPATLPIIVPKGFTKQESADTAGVQVQTFYYPNGAMIYTAYLTDTTVQLQPFNRTVHLPEIHRLGGLVYKGNDEELRYYREIQRGRFRFGYRNVSPDFEWEFDSSTNYASLQVR